MASVFGAHSQALENKRVAQYGSARMSEDGGPFVLPNKELLVATESERRDAERGRDMTKET